MAVKINEVLLARAVAAKIKPLLIDQGFLDDADHEAYHHSKVIPKAQPLLAPTALDDDARKAVTGAINASVNLLSPYETMQATEFLQTCRPQDVRDHTTKLLYGTSDLGDRIAKFLKWGEMREVKKGAKTRKVGLNGTVASYLLAMSDPKKYAFCKPSVYKAAVTMLLGSDQAFSDPVKRIVHCTEFYKAALEAFRTRCAMDRFTDLMHCHIAFYIMDKYDDIAPTWDTLAEWTPPGGDKTLTKADREEPKMKYATPLNLILYGPPGTGKTYHTMTRAVNICDSAVPENRRALTERFNQLREQGRIEFVTFHQSYGYEEFVEGIRPVLANDESAGAPEGGQELQYERHDGVFKNICNQAKVGLTTARHGVKVDLSRQRVWKMSLGNTLNTDDAGIYDECLKTNQVRLGYGNQKDFTGCDDLQAVLKKVREVEPNVTEKDYKVVSVHLFKNVMQIDDLIIVSDGNKKFRAIGRVTGGYERIDADDYDQARPVEWLVTLDESLSVDTILRKLFSQKTLYTVAERVLRVDAFSQLLSGKRPTEPLPYVLIIDEINRGNISKVFGELITLIEPDKRLGADNELRVTLPYSSERFGVPSNVYLIGTMNTADRSIAFLDTALRRRFRFQEMMPDLQVIRDNVGKNGVVEGVDVALLLDTINRRIELLYDRDHQIGHSYFLGVDSLKALRDVFHHQVIPLLQEYFHDDWIKVCHVLACPYDGENGKPLSKNPLPLITVELLDAALAHGTALPDMEPRLRYSINRELTKPSVGLADCFTAIVNGIAAVTAGPED